MDVGRDESESKVPYMIQHHYTVGSGINQSHDGAESHSSSPPQLSAAISATAITPTSIGNTTTSPSSNQYQTILAPATRQDESQPSDFKKSQESDEAPHTSAPWTAFDRSPSPLDKPDHEHGSGKYSASSIPAAVKLLVSNNVAGSIIGRSGQTISDLQVQSSTRIKLSQSGDYYPGTQDRVCLVQGQSEDIKKAVCLLLTRFYALQQQQHYHHFAWQRQQQERTLMHDSMYGGLVLGGAGDHPPLVPAFSFLVQILLPTPCCGMIIGKGGTNVKHMVDSSGVSSVRLSPKEGGGPDMPPEAMYPPQPHGFAGSPGPMSTTSERVVSITGPDLNSCLKCLYIVIDGMSGHPDISRYTNMTTSYSRIMAQDSYPPMSASRPHRHDGSVAYHGAIHQSQENLANLDGTFLDTPATFPVSPVGVRGHEGVPYNANMAGLLVPLSPNSGPFQEQQHQQQQEHSQVRSPLQAVQNSMLYGYGERISSDTLAPDLLAMQMQESLHVSASSSSEPPALLLVSTMDSKFSPQIPQATQQPPGFQAHVAVPDSLIGSILGRGGQTLNELQLLSNTRIRISQRGEFVPGTKNRIVTIRGPSAQGVTAAQFLMGQRMAQLPTVATAPAADTDSHMYGGALSQDHAPSSS